MTTENQNPETPRATVNVVLEEKIGLPNYSSVTIRSSVTRQVEDEGLPSLLEAQRGISREAIEPFISEMRGIVLKDLQEKAKPSS